MSEKFVNLRDISPLQTDLTGLPFGIHDDGHALLERLFKSIKIHNRDHRNKLDVLQALGQRFQLINDNRLNLAHFYGLGAADILVQHQLSAPFEINEQHFQSLSSDIIVKLADARKRFKQPPLCFQLGEDNVTWVQTVPNVEPRLEQTKN